MAHWSLALALALSALLIPVVSFSRVGHLIRAPPSASRCDAARDDDSERMALVRSLQKTFYENGADDAVSFDSSTGMVYNLPLWRVGWVESESPRLCVFQAFLR